MRDNIVLTSKTWLEGCFKPQKYQAGSLRNKDQGAKNNQTIKWGLREN